METNLPNNNNYEIKVKHTNSKYCRFCIRHEIPKLIKNNYLPGKVLEKINTHSYSGVVHYAQNYIISEYESMCCIQNCYICNDCVLFLNWLEMKRRRRCRTASNRLYAGEMAVSRYSSPVITCRERLKPFKIRDTAFVRFHASHEWVNVEHAHRL